MIRKTTDTLKKRQYTRPQLIRHGGLEELTKTEYGGLDKLLFGTLFAMASPGLPNAPSR